MKKVSFEEIGAVVATFLAGENAKKGQMVGLSAADTVDGCTADGKFCGLALDVTGDGVASVQVSGNPIPNYGPVEDRDGLILVR